MQESLKLLIDKIGIDLEHYPFFEDGQILSKIHYHQNTHRISFTLGLKGRPFLMPYFSSSSIR